jgi:hypothetical protein
MPDEYPIGIRITGEQPPIPVGTAVNLSGPNGHAEFAPRSSPYKFIALLGGAAAVACSRTRAGALPTDRPIRDARVPQAIGQSFDWLVPAEAEVVGARAADRPPG